jgi:hypothetical protein
MLHWFRRNIATTVKEENMVNHRLRHAAMSLAIVLGFATTTPSISEAAAAPATRGAAVMPAYHHVTAHAAIQPAWSMAFAELTTRARDPGTNPCDPITPKNWCECGGCSGSRY